MPLSCTEFFRYLPVSDQDKRWGVHVTGVGCTRVPPFARSYPISLHPDYYQFRWEKGRILQEYQALYVLAGDGEFESKSAGFIEVLPGSIMLLFPGEWHRYRPRHKVGWEEYWISFQGRHIDELVQNGFLTPGRAVWHTGVDDAILHPYLKALDRVRGEPIGYQQLLAAGVLEIVAAALAAVRRQRSSDTTEAFVREATAMLEQPAAKLLSIHQLAARFQLGEKQFRRVFKNQTGLSPYQYSLQARIHRAREMLLGTNLSIKEIAAVLHFETPFHFSAVFRKKTGMSPSQWRHGRQR
jgi:AraC-like DNA-binding protein